MKLANTKNVTKLDLLHRTDILTSKCYSQKHGHAGPIIKSPMLRTGNPRFVSLHYN